MKRVRYIAIGIMIGAVLSFTFSAAAENLNLLGREVQGQTNVYLDGEKIGDALILDGTSYGPIRAIAEASEKEVRFDEGEVYLNTPEQTEVIENSEEQTTTGPTLTEPGEEESYTIGQINGMMDDINRKIRVNEASIGENMSAENKRLIENTIADLKAELTDLEVKKAELEAVQ